MDRHDWDARYAGDELVWTAEPNRFLAAETEALAPGRALDVACGEGRNAVWLAERGWEVTGIDFSGAALAKAARLAAARGVDATWAQVDVVEDAWPAGPYDLVAHCYLHLPEPARRSVLRTAAAALAPGGVLVVVAHARANLDGGWGGPQDPGVLYEPAEVVADLEGTGLVVESADHVRRAVATPDGEREAIDLLVRARRP